MGLPQDNADGYKNGSPITFAKNLKGNLLIVHGTGDDNVHYQSFELLVNFEPYAVGQFSGTLVIDQDNNGERHLVERGLAGAGCADADFDGACD